MSFPWRLSWPPHPAMCFPSWEIPVLALFFGGWVVSVLMLVSYDHSYSLSTHFESGLYDSWRQVFLISLYRGTNWGSGRLSGLLGLQREVILGFQFRFPTPCNHDALYFTGKQGVNLALDSSFHTAFQVEDTQHIADDLMGQYANCCPCKCHPVPSGCDDLDDDKDIAWYILMDLKKLDNSLFFLCWTRCEFKKQFSFIFYLDYPLLFQIWLGGECQKQSCYECHFCHKGDFLMT